MENEILLKLANELGTTAEYLWGVLLSQAKIYAFTSSVEIICTFIFGFILYGIHKRFIKNTDNNDSIYEEYDIAAPIFMGIVSVVYVIVLMVAFFTISDVVTAIVNPEYWALKQLLNHIN